MIDNYFYICKANEQIKTTDIKGKDYAQVNERIKAFRMCHPLGSIQTEIVSMGDGIVTMQTKVFDENGVLLGTGYAQEKENSSYINKTSYIENCETSAVGRALGMCGFGIDASIASAEEMEIALYNQKIENDKLQELSVKYGALRSELEDLGCDFRSKSVNEYILQHAKIKTQDLRLLNSVELERLCKVYENLIKAKKEKDEPKPEGDE